MPGPPEVVEERIDQLSHVAAFPPPSGFAARAQARDPADYARAAVDAPAWWAEQARPRRIIWAEDPPKTRSGKIMRRLLRDIAEGREPGDVTTLRDASVLDALQQATSPGSTGVHKKGST